MDRWQDWLLDHREIETALDALAETVDANQQDAGSFRHAFQLASRHYLREQQFLARLRRHEPLLADKIAAQHAEALEIASHLEQSLSGGKASDTLYLARRFLAIARHNMIEEERDVFPLAERCFAAEDYH